MKHILFILFTVLLSFNSCNSDNNEDNSDMLGNWKKMSLSAKNADIETKDSCDYIYLSADELSFTLQVDNYKEWDICGINTQLTPTSEFKLAYYPNHGKNTFEENWYIFSTNSNQMSCTIFKNTSSETRTIKLEMSSGNVFETIYIVQSGVSNK